MVGVVWKTKLINEKLNCKLILKLHSQIREQGFLLEIILVPISIVQPSADYLFMGLFWLVADLYIFGVIVLSFHICEYLGEMNF